jgi:membrane protein YqaA with SNARE-associated domain
MPREQMRLSAAKGAQFYNISAQSTAPIARFLMALAAVVLIFAGSVWVALNPEWVLALGHWGYLGAFLIGLISSATIILPAPGIALVIAMGTALDPLLLGVVAAAGSSLGELTGYFAGATGVALVPEERREQFDRIHIMAGKYGAGIILVLASIPFPFFDLVGIIAGMLRMSIAIFLGAVFIGNSIKYSFLIWLGAGPVYLLLHYIYSLLFGI